MVVRADLGVPDEPGLRGVADPVGHARPVVDHLGAQRRVRHLVAGGDLVEADAVQVDVAEVLLRRGLGPRTTIQSPSISSAKGLK